MRVDREVRLRSDASECDRGGRAGERKSAASVKVGVDSVEWLGVGRG